MTLQIFFAAFILQAGLDTVRGYVITTKAPGGWTNPCGGSMTSAEGSIQATVPSFSQTGHLISINKIITKLNEAKDKSKELQDIFARERIQSDLLQNFLETNHLDGFPAVSFTPEQKAHMKTNLTKAHHHVFTELSKVAVFLEAVAEDEVTYNYQIHSDLIEESIRKLYSTLCEIDNLIRNLGSEIGDYVSRDIMKSEDRVILNTSYRHMRDYVIVKDCTALYNSLSELYNEMLEVLVV